MSTLRISVVVVTYRRPLALQECLSGLLRQTVRPCEIIVVDNAAASESNAGQVCGGADTPVTIRYVQGRGNSLPSARNYGGSLCTGDLLAFIDDDVRLAPDYFEAVLAVFARHVDAVGVQGYIEQAHRSRMRECLHRVFGLYHLEPDRCRVLPSVSTTYPSVLTGDVRCEWISGSNQVYRPEVFHAVKWDERLVKYADGEDLDHSFRVYKHFPGRLYITPLARLRHDEAAAGRETGRELVMMREVYGWYLLKKLFPDSPRATAAFVWSRLGRLILTAGVAAAGRRRGAWSEVWTLIRAYGYVARRRRLLAAGDLMTYNGTLGGQADG